MANRRKLIHFGILAVLSLAVFAGLKARAVDSLKKMNIEEGNPTSMQTDKQLEGHVNAPDFPAHLEWLNTDHPFSIKDFKGKIVLLDFWTFCCINCMHVIPDLKKLEAKYPEELVVIGVHSAKFQNEKETGQIRQAIQRYEIKHPVINDKNLEVWSRYGVRGWPTLVLINPNGRVIGGESGEGNYDIFDGMISKTISYFKAKGELKPGPLHFSLEESKRPDSALAFPGKISADAGSKRLFISDSNHNRIVITDPEGNVLDTIGSGRIGPDDGDFAHASFDHPQGTFLSGDLLYIADTENHLVRTADLKSREVKTLLGTGEQARGFNLTGRGREIALSSPWDLLVHEGKLYIAMAGTHQLWVADLKSLETKPYAGSGVEARIDGSLSQAALAQPSGITTDGQKLYFADSEVSSVRSADLDPKGKVETIVGEDLFEFGDIDGDWPKARLQHALGVFYQDGLVYVADTYNSKIKVIDLAKKNITTYAGTGKPGMNNGQKSEAMFNEPGGLAILDGKMYVADTNNHSIRTLDLKTGNVDTLELKNLERLETASKSGPSGRSVELPEQQMGPGKGKISLDFNLPKGFKFLTDAPSFVEWKSGDEKVLTFGPADKSSDGTVSFPVEIPVTANSGKTDVSANAVIYYCSEKSKVCLFDHLSIHIPVEISGSSNPEVHLNVDLKTPQV